MWEDPIVAEIRKHREEYAARFNYDIQAIAADLKRLEELNGWVTLDFSQQPPLSQEAKPLKRAS